MNTDQAFHGPHTNFFSPYELFFTLPVYKRDHHLRHYTLPVTQKNQRKKYTQKQPKKLPVCERTMSISASMSNAVFTTDDATDSCVCVCVCVCVCCVCTVCVMCVRRCAYVCMRVEEWGGQNARVRE